MASPMAKRALHDDDLAPRPKRVRGAFHDSTSVTGPHSTSVTGLSVTGSHDMDDDSATSTSQAGPLDATSTATGANTTQASTPTTTTKYRPREKKFLCDYPDCHKSFARPVTLADHQRSHTNERPFVCSRVGCSKSFLRDTHLKHHIKAHHDGVRDYRCDWPDCGRGFATGQRLRAHRERHESREQCRCTGFPPCEQYFRKQETLQRHIAAVHLGDAPFVCDHQEDESGDTCARRFKQGFSLKQHKDRDHAGFKHACTLCGRSTDNASAFGDAGNTAFSHAGNTAFSHAGDTAFATFSELQAHIKAVHPPTCVACGHTCSTIGQLRAHMDIEHEDVESRRTVPCQDPNCDKIFTKRGNMMIHYKSTHEKSRFVCGVISLSGSQIAPGWDGTGGCGEGFTTKASLAKHVRTQHLHLPLAQSKGKEKRRDRKARRQTQEEAGEQIDPRLDETMMRLTGVGYDIQRPIPCVRSDCPQRFKRSYDLELHLLGGHAYTIAQAFDAVEGIREMEAISGGHFWVGGSGDADDVLELEDQELASRLAHALS